eukprot:2543485-Prymnesium_polylepis.1
MRASPGLWFCVAEASVICVRCKWLQSEPQVRVWNVKSGGPRRGPGRRTARTEACYALGHASRER